MWNTTSKEINDAFAWRKFHLRTLLDYDLEFEPTDQLNESLTYLRPLSSYVALYQEAIINNSVEGLELAKGKLRKVFARYL